MKPTIPETKKLMITVNRNLHGLMREYAKRKRIHVGLAYDMALEAFLRSTDAYMGSNNQRLLKKGIN